MSKVFYYDFFALQGVDVATWEKDFFWTVPRETTTKIATDFHRQLAKMADDEGDCFAGDCILIGYLIPIIYITPLVNHFVSVSRILEKGYEIKYSDHLELLPILLDQDRNDIHFDHETFKKSSSGLSPRGVVRNVRNKYHTIKYNFKKGSYNFLNLWKKDAVMAFGADNVIDRTYTRSLKEWVNLTDNQMWLKGFTGNLLSTEQKDVLTKVTDNYLAFLKNYILDNFQLDFKQKLWDALHDYVSRYFFSIGELYLFLQKKVTKKCPKLLLTPTGSKTFTRALSLAVRKAGGKVTGFPHGYYISHHSGYRRSLHEFATVDRFMAYSPGSIELFKRNVEINPLPRGHQIQFLHENTPFFKNVWEEYSVLPRPDKIKTVMVLELSLIPEWAGYYAAESLVNYHFYYNICKTLSDAGYKVIFKRRPKDISWEGINLFEDLTNVEIVYGSFEDPEIIEKTDAVIIQYGMSSTLFWAMCTNKTVIYADAGWEEWFPDVYESMAKRCRILTCDYDDRNRCCFDQQQLLDIVSSAPEELNTEFLENYLFPE